MLQLFLFIRSIETLKYYMLHSTFDIIVHHKEKKTTNYRVAQVKNVHFIIF